MAAPQRTGGTRIACAVQPRAEGNKTSSGRPSVIRGLVVVPQLVEGLRLLGVVHQLLERLSLLMVVLELREGLRLHVVFIG